MSRKRKTLRQSIVNCLDTAGRPLSCRELSIMLGISEKDIPEHVQHIAKTLRSQGKRLSIVPAECRTCGYAFEKRKKPGQPSRCPHCKSERIEPPLFGIHVSNPEGDM
ncbi:MAG: transcriptional regulator [Desulfovermiculus sp.]